MQMNCTFSTRPSFCTIQRESPYNTFFFAMSAPRNWWEDHTEQEKTRRKTLIVYFFSCIVHHLEDSCTGGWFFSPRPFGARMGCPKLKSCRPVPACYSLLPAGQRGRELAPKNISLRGEQPPVWWWLISGAVWSGKKLCENQLKCMILFSIRWMPVAVFVLTNGGFVKIFGQRDFHSCKGIWTFLSIFPFLNDAKLGSPKLYLQMSNGDVKYTIEYILASQNRGRSSCWVGAVRMYGTELKLWGVPLANFTALAAQ